MATSHYLLKSEPNDYSWDDLVRDGSTVWDGVRNNAALLHMRGMKKGDLAFLYHTGKERAAVGVMRLTSDPYPDPDADDPKVVVFDVEPVEKLARPVPLSAVKADPAFADFALVRQSRLSAMPVPDDLWQRMMEMSRG
jgi:predicted RNA-binding protein with PUA-like domain